MRSRLFSTFLACVAMAGAPVAAAQDRAQPLLGERALGMGGAVTGSSRGPTAAYYNPAGMTADARTALGGSLSLRTFRAYNVQDAYTSSVGVEDIDDTALTTMSVFLGGMVAFGGRTPLGHRQHALGAGTLLRSAVDRSFIDTAIDPDRDRASSLDVIQARDDRWYYVAYALRPDDRFALGLTAALSVRGEQYTESITDGEGLSASPETARLSARDVDIELTAIHLVLRAGATLRLTEWLQAGLVLQSPGIPLTSSGSAVFQRLSVAGADSTLFRRELDSIDASVPAPWEARAGLYARIAPELGLALDVGLVGPAGSANDPWSVLGEPVPVDRGRPSATYFAAERAADLGVEAALGVEIEAFDEVPLRGGVFFERSGNRRIDSPVDRYPLDAVDRIGTTLSVGLHDSNYDFTIGASYAYGFGSGARPNPDMSGAAYIPTGVESHEIVVVLSGVTGAAAELALEAYNAVTGADDETLPDEVLLDRLPMPARRLSEEELLERLPMPAREDADDGDAADDNAADDDAADDNAADDDAADDNAAEPPPSSADPDEARSAA